MYIHVHMYVQQIYVTPLQEHVDIIVESPEGKSIAGETGELSVQSIHVCILYRVESVLLLGSFYLIPASLCLSVTFTGCLHSTVACWDGSGGPDDMAVLTHGPLPISNTSMTCGFSPIHVTPHHLLISFTSYLPSRRTRALYFGGHVIQLDNIIMVWHILSYIQR